MVAAASAVPKARVVKNGAINVFIRKSRINSEHSSDLSLCLIDQIQLAKGCGQRHNLNIHDYPALPSAFR
jgi:hypothetical protein